MLSSANKRFQETSKLPGRASNMRAVIDTGVWVSGLIRRQGTTGDVLRALRDGRFTEKRRKAPTFKCGDIRRRLYYNIERDRNIICARAISHRF